MQSACDWWRSSFPGTTCSSLLFVVDFDPGGLIWMAATWKLLLVRVWKLRMAWQWTGLPGTSTGQTQDAIPLRWRDWMEAPGKCWSITAWMNLEPLLSFPRRGRCGVIGGAGEGLHRGRLEEEVVGGRRDVPCESAVTSKGLTLSDL